MSLSEVLLIAVGGGTKQAPAKSCISYLKGFLKESKMDCVYHTVTIGGQGRSGWWELFRIRPLSKPILYYGSVPLSKSIFVSRIRQNNKNYDFLRKTLVTRVKPIQISTIFSELYPKMQKFFYKRSVWNEHFPFSRTISRPSDTLLHNLIIEQCDR